MNSPFGRIKSKVEKQWQKNISLFQTIPNRKYVRQMLAYPDTVIGLIQTNFISLNACLPGLCIGFILTHFY